MSDPVIDSRQMVADAKKFLAQFGGIFKMAQLLEGLNSIEEAKGVAQAELDRLLTQAGEIKAKHDMILQDARSNAEQIVIAAKAAAEKIAQDATRAHAQVVEEAQGKATDIVAKATKTVVDVQKQKDMLEAAIVKARQDHADLSVAVEEKANLHDRLADEIEQKTKTLNELQDKHDSFLKSIGAK